MKFEIAPFDRVAPEQINAFAYRNCIALPDDYKGFLLEKNGGILKSMACLVKDLEEKIAVDIFFGLTGRPGLDLQRWLDQYRDEMPPGFLIIAGDPGGNFFIMGTKRNQTGIYYWDHTHFFPGSSEEKGNTFPIATNFTEFLEQLVPFE